LKQVNQFEAGHSINGMPPQNLSPNSSSFSKSGLDLSHYQGQRQERGNNIILNYNISKQARPVELAFVILSHDEQGLTR
jgi:hypothetical protein